MAITEHGKRMLDYYPPAIKKILEFQAITHSEGYEFDDLKIKFEDVLNDAYLYTMGESRISQWEKLLGIRPLEESTLDDRRETVIARLRGQGKLNTELINSIVKTFTGGTAKSSFDYETGNIYVEITPPPGNKSYKFSNVEQELKHKVPAHLNIIVTRNYNIWREIQRDCPTWQSVMDTYATWNDVLIHNPTE